MRGSGNCWFYLYLSLLSPNLPYFTPLNPPHSSRMCHKSQFLEEVRSDNALFLHCLLSLIMNFLKERTMTCIFCCLLTCLHRVKPMRSAQEIATKQSGLMPFKAGLLGSPQSRVPHSSHSGLQGLYNLLLNQPLSGLIPHPFSHNHSALATLATLLFL